MTSEQGKGKRPAIRHEPIFVDRETAAAALALSVSTFEREVALGNLPKPRRISTARVGWLWSELVTCAAGMPVSDLLPPENTGAPKPRGRSSTSTPPVPPTGQKAA